MYEAFNIAKVIKERFTLDSKVPKKIWPYDAKTLQLINGQPFDSIGKAADFIYREFWIVLYFIDSWKPYSGLGIYFFSNPLTESDIQKLVGFYKVKVTIFIIELEFEHIMLVVYY